MNKILVDSTQWQWSVTSLNLQPIDLGIPEFESQLKEKLAIDKASSTFMRAALQIGKTEDVAKSVIKGTEPLVLKSRFVIPPILECAPGRDKEKENSGQDRIELYFKSLEHWNNSYDGFMKIIEFECLPKEVITVRKEIKAFVKEALKSGFDLPSLTKIERFNRGFEKYKVEIMNVTSENNNRTSFDMFQDIPDVIPLVEDTDKQHIVENLSDDDAAMLQELQSPTETIIQKLKKKSDYLFKVEQNFVSPDSINYTEFNTWEEPNLTVTQLTNTKSLELHLLSEELEKGLEFRITPPYMDQSPSYKESRTSLDYAELKTPKKLKIPQTDDPVLYFKYLASKFKECDLVNEDCADQTLEIFDEVPDKMIRLVTASDYIIRDGNTDNIMINAYKSETEHKETPPPPGFNVSMRRKSKNTIVEPQEPVKASSVSIAASLHKSTHVDPDDSDTTSNMSLQRTTIEDDTTTKFNHNDSLHVTKMATTFLDANQTSISKEKRTIDDELEELITRKRRPRNTTASGKPTTFRLPLLEYLKGDQPTEAMITINDQDKKNKEEEDVIIIEEQPTSQVNLFDDIFKKVKGLVGFNLHYLNENQPYLRFLDSNASGLKILELDMGQDAADFLINEDTGVYIIQARSLEQLNLDGKLIIGGRLLKIKSSLRTVYVVLATDGLVQRETLLNFQVMTSLMGIRTIITTKIIKHHCELICKLVEKNGIKTKITMEEFESLMTDPQVEFLVDCGVNHFAAVQMLMQYSLLEIIGMGHTERLNRFKFLTQEIDLRMEKMFNLEWSICC